MNIGIDVDGVLTELEKWQFEYGSKYYKKEIISPESYKTYDIFNVSKESDDIFWNLYRKEYTSKVRVKEKASEVIRKLKSEGFNIIIVTAREYTIEDTKRGLIERKTLKKWLKKNKIYYDELVYTTENKIKAIKDKKIDIMIEDSYDNIKSLSKYVPVMAVDAIYNKKAKGKNIIRVYSWYDLYYKINELKKR